MTFLSEEFAKTNSLSTEQVQALTTAINDYSADLKKEYAGVANENAEKIIQGALTSTQEKFGITAQREQGEKIPDDLKSEVEAKVEACRSALQGEDLTQIQTTVQNLSESLQKVGAAMYQEPETPPPGDGDYAPPPEDDGDVVEGEFSET